MSGLRSKTKGANGERELAKLLQNWIGLDIKRALGQAREGGADILSIPGLVIEVKRQEVLKLAKWWEQVNEAACNKNDLPILAYRQNRKPWKFCLPYTLLDEKAEWDFFIELDERAFCIWITDYVIENDLGNGVI